MPLSLLNSVAKIITRYLKICVFNMHSYRFSNHNSFSNCVSILIALLDEDSINRHGIVHKISVIFLATSQKNRIFLADLNISYSENFAIQIATTCNFRSPNLLRLTIDAEVLTRIIQKSDECEVRLTAGQ